jgi:hypothetical protein
MLLSEIRPGRFAVAYGTKPWRAWISWTCRRPCSAAKELPVRPILILAAFAAALSSALIAGAAEMTSIDSYRWNNRVLVMFAQPGDPLVAAQRDEMMRYEPDLVDRDLVVFAVIGNERIEPVFGRSPPDEQAAALRKHFDVATDAGFAALLVGKDGGVKWREDRPAGHEELFQLIDAMPMRRSGN